MSATAPLIPFLPPSSGAESSDSRPEFNAPPSAEQVRAGFQRDQIYPVRLSIMSASPTLVRLFTVWRELAAVKFTVAGQPWLPVGHVGPMLVLGHCEPRTDAWLPRSWFQPVLLSRADYERHLRECAEWTDATLPGDLEEIDLVPPRRAFPPPSTLLVRPTTLRAALRFLLEYFPNGYADVQRVHNTLVEVDEISASDLPSGYFGACWRLLERGAIADPAMASSIEHPMRKLPVDLQSRVRVISEHGKNLWLGAERLPQPEVEDRLLNELGDEWHVHFLLLDGSRSIERTGRGEKFSPRYGQDVDPRAGRARVKIDDPRRRIRGSDNGRQPGIIRLNHKDLRELEAYDARRPDRDPLRVFLKELSAGIMQGATDLHVEVGLDTCRIRARIDGYLEEWLEMPVDFGRMVIGAAKEQFGMPPERWMPQDGACTVFHGEDVVNLRIGAFPIRGHAQKLAIRFLPRRGNVPKLDELMPPREAALMRRAITRPYGLILMCGPTGSGKTTTTFAALSEINAPDVNITTLEDPVEYEMEGVNQAELDRARGVDWDVLLSGFLRQDPDIGLLGEIRDRATAETAIRLTLTGHIVFATLHTMSCAHTVERLIDTGVNAQMFANAATLIVSQRLVRRLCLRCKEEGRRDLTPEESAILTRHGCELPAVVYDACRSGCAGCRGTGYKGQIGAFEVLPVIPEVAQLIADKSPVRAIERWMQEHNLPRVHDAALALVARGDTSFAEANQWQAVWEDITFPASLPKGAA